MIEIYAPVNAETCVMRIENNGNVYWCDESRLNWEQIGRVDSDGDVYDCKNQSVGHVEEYGVIYDGRSGSIAGHYNEQTGQIYSIDDDDFPIAEVEMEDRSIVASVLRDSIPPDVAAAAFLVLGRKVPDNDGHFDAQAFSTSHEMFVDDGNNEFKSESELSISMQNYNMQNPPPIPESADQSISRIQSQLKQAYTALSADVTGMGSYAKAAQSSSHTVRIAIFAVIGCLLGFIMWGTGHIFIGILFIAGGFMLAYANRFKLEDQKALDGAISRLNSILQQNMPEKHNNQDYGR